MASVYGDISGSESGILSAGCYLGRADEWKAAVQAWTDILADAGVDVFHATDFYNAQGAFDDDRWRHWVSGKGMQPGGREHVEFAKRFCAVADDAGLIGFAFAMDVQPFREILAPELEKEQRQFKSSHPRIHGVMSSLAAIGDFLSRTTYREQGQIPVIFEEEQGAGKLVSFFDESRERRERWTYWFRSFETAPKATVQLQIADLLAHESWRRAKQVLAENPQAIRKSFLRMLGRDRIALRWHGIDHCHTNAQRVRDALATHPTGLLPPSSI